VTALTRRRFLQVGVGVDVVPGDVLPGDPIPVPGVLTA
jgi:hypothetical protein